MPVALFVFKNASPTEIYTLSLHDALPIFLHRDDHLLVLDKPHDMATMPRGAHVLSSALVRLRRATGITTLSPLHRLDRRSEEHTSELQSRGHLVCRLLLEKKKDIKLRLLT